MPKVERPKVERPKGAAGIIGLPKPRPKADTPKGAAGISAECLSVYRQVLGAFETFLPTSVTPRRLQHHAAFDRHIALDLSLPPHLALMSANPGWEEVTVHAFTLRADLAAGLNRTLRTHALELESAGDGLTVSNVGAFHSQRLLSNERPLARLRVAASRAARAAHADEHGARSARPRRPTSLWCNVSRVGHHHGLHDHQAASWSGVYYVQVPSKPAREGSDYSGRIAFRTAFGGIPGVGVGQATARTFATDPKRPEGWCAFAHVDPAPGLLLVFPSWLLHCVLPVAPDEHGADGAERVARISYSFNFGESA